MAHNCQGKTKTSRQKQKHHGKTKNLTAKPKTSRQKQKPHGKTKDLTAKPNASDQKQDTLKYLMAKPKLFCFCCEVLGFAGRFFVFAVRFSVLHEVFGFAWGFWFCYDVFVFAVRFLVLPWQLWATIKNTVKIVMHKISSGEVWSFWSLFFRALTVYKNFFLELFHITY